MPVSIRKHFLPHVLIIVLACLAVSAQQADRASAIWDSTPHVHSDEQVTISPDATQLAWTDGAHAQPLPTSQIITGDRKSVSTVSAAAWLVSSLPSEAA
jgi:hypothetical protein